MTKEGMIDFIKTNCCDIEAAALPKVVGCLPTEERLFTKAQWETFIAHADAVFGEKFADFLEANTAKGFRCRGKRKSRFFWLDFDNWDFMHDCWQRCESGEIPL